jgi:hypothetical protein
MDATADAPPADSMVGQDARDDASPEGCEPQPVATPIVSASATVNGSEFLYAAPDAPVGLVAFFTGAMAIKKTTSRCGPRL